MPLVVQSPLAAAANSAAAFMQGQQERAMQQRAAALAQQKQDSESALQAAQGQMYLGHGSEYQAQGDQRTALTPSMVAKNVANAAMQDAHGNLFDARGNFITGPETNYETAKTGLTTAQTGLANANTGLTNAKTQVQIQGELPFLKSKTILENSLPAYNASKIQALNNATDTRAFSAAQATAARINIAGMDNQSKVVLGSMINDRIANGDTEAQATKGALEQYQLGVQTYNQGTRTNAQLQEKGLPQNPNPVPVYNNPNNSQGGVPFQQNAPSASIRISIDPTTGQPVPIYNRQPARSINVPGEVNALRSALTDGKHDPNKVMAQFNTRTDIPDAQKAMIWTSANTPLPGTPSPNQGGFQVPLTMPGAAPKPPSVGGGAFGLPQTPFSINGQ